MPLKQRLFLSLGIKSLSGQYRGLGSRCWLSRSRWMRLAIIDDVETRNDGFRIIGWDRNLEATRFHRGDIFQAHDWCLS